MAADEQKPADARKRVPEEGRWKFWFTLSVLFGLGVLLMLLPQEATLHLPFPPHTVILQIPGWLFELVNKLGDALVIAAVIAFAVDTYVKRALVSEVARDAVRFAVGYALPDDVLHHVQHILRLPCVRHDLDFRYEFREVPAPAGHSEGYFEVTCTTSYAIENLTAHRISFPVRTSIQNSDLPGLPQNHLYRLHIPAVPIDWDAEDLAARSAQAKADGTDDPNYRAYTTVTEEVKVPPGRDNALQVQTVRVFYYRLEDSIFLDLLQPPSMGLNLHVSAASEYIFDASFGSGDKVTLTHDDGPGSWDWRVPGVHLPGSHFYFTWRRNSTQPGLTAHSGAVASGHAQP